MSTVQSSAFSFLLLMPLVACAACDIPTIDLASDACSGGSEVNNLSAQVDSAEYVGCTVIAGLESADLMGVSAIAYVYDDEGILTAQQSLSLLAPNETGTFNLDPDLARISFITTYYEEDKDGEQFSSESTGSSGSIVIDEANDTSWVGTFSAEIFDTDGSDASLIIADGAFDITFGAQ